MIVVMVPAPEMSGKARGTIEEVVESSVFSWNIFMPNVISNPMRKIIIAPAIANEATSTPKSLRIESPRYKKLIIRIPAAMVAFSDSIWPAFLRNSIIMGIEPRISITENRIRVTERICFRLNIYC
jgi:hypothetical protein